MKNYLIIVICIILFSSCEKDIDTEKPTIDVTSADAFPVNCDTMYFGEPFELKVLFADNMELGSFSIDIHNNFDHHSHSTEVSECNLGEVRIAENPFMVIEYFEIPEGSQSYSTNTSINIPSQNEKGIFDEGDYHFFISLTDKEGWSAQKGLSVKMLYR